MGARGPVPNRSEDLARDRSRKGGDQTPITRGLMRSVAIPAADPDWDPIATMIWDALSASGQSEFYQQTDWAFAWSLCEDLSRYKEGRINTTTGELYFKRSPEMLKALMAGMSSLLMTEADRRRAHIELSHPAPAEDAAAVLVLADYREGLGIAQ